MIQLSEGVLIFGEEYLHKKMRYPENITKHRYVMDNNHRDFFYVHQRSNTRNPGEERRTAERAADHEETPQPQGL